MASVCTRKKRIWFTLDLNFSSEVSKECFLRKVEFRSAGDKITSGPSTSEEAHRFHSRGSVMRIVI